MYHELSGTAKLSCSVGSAPSGIPFRFLSFAAVYNIFFFWPSFLSEFIVIVDYAIQFLRDNYMRQGGLMSLILLSSYHM